MFNSSEHYVGEGGGVNGEWREGFNRGCQNYVLFVKLCDVSCETGGFSE